MVSLFEQDEIVIPLLSTQGKKTWREDSIMDFLVLYETKVIHIYIVKDQVFENPELVLQELSSRVQSSIGMKLCSSWWSLTIVTGD